ncbi:MAG: tetratricopeptide repeat protein, partial [Opitutales bacterium]|nr:tetratricopeptide repeat protein [Opitutales bacterium]
GILSRYPACAEVRKILRAAQRKRAGKPNPVLNLFGAITGSIFAAKAAGLSKKGEIAKVLEDGEKLLMSNPYNSFVLNAMASACEKAEYWSTAALCYQHIADASPKNTKNLMAWGKALLKSLKPDEAMSVGETILRAEPINGDAQNLMREASVIKTMLKEKWDEEGDFRSNIKDSDETANREAETRIANDEETLKAIVEREKKQLESDPENINLYRDVAQHLRALKRFSEALEFIRKARTLPMGKADTMLEKMEQDLAIGDMELRINSAKERLDANPADAAAQKEYEDLQKQEHAFRLENAKKMVERYPNDFNFRFALGQLLLDDGDLDGAIAQFQISQRNPKVRQLSLLGLGRAFIMGKKYDLAIDQLETAKKEILTMNDAKKEVIYELATAYEKMNNPEKAFLEYKEIYSSDIGYKDVASKINAYYASRNK